MAAYPRLRLVAPQILLSNNEFDETEAGILTSAKTVDELVERLQGEGRLKALATTIPFLLPKREATWTACLWAKVAETAYGAKPSRALQAAEYWVREQAEDARYKAFELAMAEDLDRPGAWAGVCAYWSGKSMAPPDAEPVVPEGHLAPCAAGIVLTLATTEAGDTPACAQDMAALALDVAAGRNGISLLADITARGAGRGGHEPTPAE